MGVRQSIAIPGESSVYDFESKGARFEARVVLERSSAYDFESKTVRRGWKVVVDRFSNVHFQSKRNQDRLPAYQKRFSADDSSVEHEDFRLRMFHPETKNEHSESKIEHRRFLHVADQFSSMGFRVAA
jgi:hypothetical protein